MAACIPWLVTTCPELRLCPPIPLSVYLTALSSLVPYRGAFVGFRLCPPLVRSSPNPCLNYIGRDPTSKEVHIQGDVGGRLPFSRKETRQAWRWAASPGLWKSGQPLIENAHGRDAGILASCLCVSRVRECVNVVSFPEEHVRPRGVHISLHTVPSSVMIRITNHCRAGVPPTAVPVSQDTGCDAVVFPYLIVLLGGCQEAQRGWGHHRAHQSHVGAWRRRQPITLPTGPV